MFGREGVPFPAEEQEIERPAAPKPEKALEKAVPQRIPAHA